jgi:hypothetical protein
MRQHNNTMLPSPFHTNSIIYVSLEYSRFKSEWKELAFPLSSHEPLTSRVHLTMRGVNLTELLSVGNVPCWVSAVPAIRTSTANLQ